MLVVAGISMYYWTRADWFTDPGPYAYQVWTGYNVPQFVALVFLCYTAPVGMVCILVTMQQLLRRTVHPIVTVLLAVTFLALFIAGAVWFGALAYDPFFLCFYVGCTNSKDYTYPPNPNIAEAGLGWQSAAGTGAFIILVGLGVSMLCAVVVSAYRVHTFVKDEEESNPLMATQAKSLDTFKHYRDHVLYRPSPRRDWALYFITLLPVLLFFVLATTTVPNSWEYFKADRIAFYAQEQVTHNTTECNGNIYYGIFICPEMPDATFLTYQIKVNDYWYLKFFPGNVMYYTVLMGFPGIMMMIRANRRLRSWMRQPVLSTRWFALSYGEFGACGVLFVLLTMWCVYWWRDHNYNTYWPLLNGSQYFPIGYGKIYYTERMARGFGQIAVLFFSLLVFPAARTSVFHTAFDISWELGIRYHRILGCFFLGAAFLHMVTTYAFYYYSTGSLADIFQVPMSSATSVDNFTVPLMTLVLWSSFLIYALAVVDRVRRKVFELFYYFHILGFLLLVPSILWHAAAGWELMLPSLSVWFWDRLIRFYRSSQKLMNLKVKSFGYGSAGNVTEITCEAPFSYYAGQYCFLNVSEISLFEWHPFTISCSDPKSLSFHIKDMGPGTFTGMLYQTVSRGHMITVSVDGPYGNPLDYYRYKTIILVAGGIGITPVKSIFESLVANHTMMPSLRAVHLVWVARDSKIFALMKSAVTSAPTSNFFIHLFLFCPDARVSMELDFPIAPHFGKPNFDVLFNSIHDDGKPEETVMFVCAPQGIVDQCHENAMQRGCDFHTEVFNL